MATIEKRGQFWRVKIRRAGLMAQTKTFDNRTHAQQWARSVESDLDKGIVVDRRTAQPLSLAEVLERYRREVGRLTTKQWAGRHQPRTASTCQSGSASSHLT